MKTLFYSRWYLLAMLCLPLINVNAQDDKRLLQELIEAEEEAIHALVLYPEETRLAILEATRYPEILIKIESIQSQTRTSFQQLLEDYPQSTQEMIWDLTRYPELIDKLVKQNPNWEELLTNYPDVIHRRAKEAVDKHLSELETIQYLNQLAQSAFEELLLSYPTTTQDALRHLLPLPEVLSILTDNIRLVVLAGALYRNEPDWLLAQVDSLHLEVARENAQELAAWKASLESDPKALQQLSASAEAFSSEYSYDDEYYDYAEDDLYYQERTKTREAHDFYYYHFPYWFGYPHWYYYPRWRLYPSWYDWGFYFDSGRNIIIISLPSFYYTHWYFHFPSHHQRWSHLSAHFTRHRHAHPRLGSSIATGVSVWQHQNRDLVSREWLVEDGKLSNRFREFGKFETQRSKYNRSHPKARLTQRQFIERNSKRYPEIAKTAVRPTGPTTTIIRPPKPLPTESGDKLKTETRKPKRTPSLVLPPKQKPEIKKRKKVKQTPSSFPPQVKEGTERHRNLSERSKATRAPKVQPRKPQLPSPKTKTVKPKTRTKTRKVLPRKKNNF